MTTVTVALLTRFKTPEVPFTLHPRKKVHDQIALIRRAKSYETLTARVYMKKDKRKPSIFGERVIHTDETGALCTVTPR